MEKIYGIVAFVLLVPLVGILLLWQTNVITIALPGEQAAATVLSRTQYTEVAKWIQSLQYKTNSRDASFGAITVSDGIAVYEDGTERPLRRVIPYFAHLGVLGLMDSGASGHLTTTQRWLQWYMRNRDQSVGVPLDTWYSVDGKYGTTCPKANDPLQCNTVDAVDSSAALFLLVADKFVTKGGSKSFVTGNKTAVREIENTLLSLIDTDGLSWAKENYKIKYMMDNVEVLAGLEAAARLERNVFRDTTRANMLTTRANTLRTALYGTTNSFYNASTSQFAVYKDEAGTKGVSNMTTWYPDLMAQIWPAAFDQNVQVTPRVNAITALTKQLPARALETGDCAAVKTVTAGAHAPVLGYVLKKAGYTGADPLMKCIYADVRTAYAWPFTVADAGWLIR
jgi:hypothetical protein